MPRKHGWAPTGGRLCGGGIGDPEEVPIKVAEMGSTNSQSACPQGEPGDVSKENNQEQTARSDSKKRDQEAKPTVPPKSKRSETASSEAKERDDGIPAEPQKGEQQGSKTNTSATKNMAPSNDQENMSETIYQENVTPSAPNTNGKETNTMTSDQHNQTSAEPGPIDPKTKVSQSESKRTSQESIAPPESRRSSDSVTTAVVLQTTFSRETNQNEK